MRRSTHAHLQVSVTWQVPHCDVSPEEAFDAWSNSWFEVQAPTTMDLGEVHSHDDIALFNLRWQRYVSWDSAH